MIKAADLQAGMILAQPLKDLAGRTLLKEGAVLTDQYIQRIRNWGFEELAVQGEGEAPAPPPVVGYQIKGRAWPEIAAEIERRFSLSLADPSVMKLKAAVLDRVRELVKLHAGN